MDRMLAVAVLGLLTLGADAGRLHTIADSGGLAARMLSRKEVTVETARTPSRLDAENHTPRREIEDMQAPCTLTPTPPMAARPLKGTLA